MKKWLENRAHSLGVMAMLVTAMCSTAHAGEYATDRPGGKDIPLISRYAGSILYNYGEVPFDEAKIYTRSKQNGGWQHVEGKISNRIYWAPKGRSATEILRNYQMALTSAGFQIMYQCHGSQCDDGVYDNGDNDITDYEEKAKWQEEDTYNNVFNDLQPNDFYYLSAQKASASGTTSVQIGLNASSIGSDDVQGRVQQFLQVVETGSVETGKVVVNADAIRGSLQRDGRIALYGIQFDTNMATIKPESNQELAEMAKVLKADASMKVYIVGHTDNQGQTDINIALSQRRAEAVVATLASKYGVASTRLSARGVADFAPVASNENEAGRSKNRRVEMVLR